ncbi:MULTISPECIES: IS5 family transposase [unclassified Acinetobacter]|uniref:IS5 family transposase n=1 Tax=unclassified Acinetobacter TaxID=196816 RepID=UPI0015D35BA2|nr:MULTISPECIES: IS5 family transposase [unclassified Acinetobacter]
MPRTMLTDQHWQKLKVMLLNLSIHHNSNLRNFIEAILYRIRTGCPWRDIPSCFGHSNSIFKRFNRWSSSGKLLKLFKLLASCPDMEWIFIDGSHVCAHQHSAGIANQSISKSIGGNSSKIYLIVDAHGNPIDFMITDGTTHDVKVAPDLISTLDLKETKVVCADKGYDSESLREQIRKTRTKANIPRKTNSQSNNDHMDCYLYKIRHLVENMFCRLKEFRGIATRYDKLKRNYQSSVALACIFLWLPL